MFFRSRYKYQFKHSFPREIPFWKFSFLFFFEVSHFEFLFSMMQ